MTNKLKYDFLITKPFSDSTDSLYKQKINLRLPTKNHKRVSEIAETKLKYSDAISKTIKKNFSQNLESLSTQSLIKLRNNLVKNFKLYYENSREIWKNIFNPHSDNKNDLMKHIDNEFPNLTRYRLAGFSKQERLVDPKGRKKILKQIWDLDKIVSQLRQITDQTGKKISDDPDHSEQISEHLNAIDKLTGELNRFDKKVIKYYLALTRWGHHI